MWHSAARRVLKFSAAQECATPLEFEADMVRFFRETCRGYGTNVAFGVVLKGVLGLVRKHRVTLDGCYKFHSVRETDGEKVDGWCACASKVRDG